MWHQDTLVQQIEEEFNITPIDLIKYQFLLELIILKHIELDTLKVKELVNPMILEPKILETDIHRIQELAILKIQELAILKIQELVIHKIQEVVIHKTLEFIILKDQDGLLHQGPEAALQKDHRCLIQELTFLDAPQYQDLKDLTYIHPEDINQLDQQFHSNPGHLHKVKQMLTELTHLEDLQFLVVYILPSTVVMMNQVKRIL